MKKFFKLFFIAVSVYAVENVSPSSPISPAEFEALREKINILTEQTRHLDQMLQEQLSVSGANAIDNLTKKALTSKEKDGNLEDYKKKSGFLLGTTLAIREFTADQVIQGFEQLTQTTPSLQVGIVLGYQHYFNSVFGLRLEGFFDASGKAKVEHRTPLLALTPAVADPRPSSATYASTPAVTIQDIAQTYLPIKASAEATMLIDVYTKDQHSAGFGLGLGYEVAWYIVTKATADVKSNAVILNNILQKPEDLLDSSLYATIGVHYYYGKHQFELKYKFGKYAFVDSAKSWIFDANGVAIPTTTKLSITSDISINYTYRF